MHSVIELIRQGAAETAFQITQKESVALKPGEVRIAVESSGINFAEVLARLGLYPEAPKPPFVPGYEVVGRISEVAPDVKDHKVGDRVVSGCLFGGYASEVCVPSYFALKIDEKLDAAMALALVTQGVTAAHVFEFAITVYPEDLVLIHAAASGVGILLCQMALARGCEVIGTCGSEEKVQFLQSLGVHHAINYRKYDFTREIKRRLPKKRVDVVFDSIGGTTLRKSYALLGSGGRLVSYGIADTMDGKHKYVSMLKTTLTSGLFHPFALLGKSKTLVGVNLLSILRYKPYISRAAFEKALALLDEGVLKPQVAKHFAAAEVAAAHALVESRTAIGKVALAWN